MSIDLSYEFQAPHYYDFSDNNNDLNDTFFKKEFLLPSESNTSIGEYMNLETEIEQEDQKEIEAAKENTAVLSNKPRNVPELKPKVDIKKHETIKHTINNSCMTPKSKSGFGSSVSRSLVPEPAENIYTPRKTLVMGSVQKVKESPNSILKASIPKITTSFGSTVRPFTATIQSARKATIPSSFTRPATAVSASARKPVEKSTLSKTAISSKPMKASVRPVPAKPVEKAVFAPKVAPKTAVKAVPVKSVFISSSSSTRVPLSARKAAEKAAPKPVVKAVPFQPRTTIPVSPKFQTSARIKGAHELTFEGRELARIAAELEEQRKIRERNSKNMFKVLASVTEIVPVRSTAPLTVPHEFSFSTHARPSRPSMSQPTTPRSNVPQEKACLKYVPPKDHWEPKITVTKPFELALDVRVPVKPVESEFVSMKAIADNLFRSRSEPAIAPKFTAGLTIPQEFHFVVDDRIAIKNADKEILTTEDRIVKELAAVPAFKAAPVDIHVYQPDITNVHGRGISTQFLTEPVSPMLVSKTRVKPVAPVVEEVKPVFHALPFNSKLFNEAPKLPAVSQKEVTIPKSPAFHLKNRIPERKEETPEPPKKVVLKEVKPFALATEVRGDRFKAMFEAHLKAEQEEEMKQREFHAAPMLNFTEKPIELSKALLFTKSMRDLEAQTPQVTEFKAQPLPKSFFQPYVPAIAPKEPTQPEPFHCYSNVRADKRKEYDENHHAAELEQAELAKQVEAEERLREAEQVRQLRESLNFKARPTFNKKFFELKRSEKTLTDPVSPPFKSKLLKKAVKSDNSENESVVANA